MWRLFRLFHKIQNRYRWRDVGTWNSTREFPHWSCMFGYQIVEHTSRPMLCFSIVLFCHCDDAPTSFAPTFIWFPIETTNLRYTAYFAIYYCPWWLNIAGNSRKTRQICLQTCTQREKMNDMWPDSTSGYCCSVRFVACHRPILTVILRHRLLSLPQYRAKKHQLLHTNNFPPPRSNR